MGSPLIDGMRANEPADWKRGRRLLSLACQGLEGWYEEETGQCFRLDGTPCELGDVPRSGGVSAVLVEARAWARRQMVEIYAASPLLKTLMQNAKAVKAELAAADGRRGDVPGLTAVLDPLGDSAGWVRGNVTVSGEMRDDGSFGPPTITVSPPQAQVPPPNPAWAVEPVLQPAIPIAAPAARLPARAFILPIDGRAPRI